MNNEFSMSAAREARIDRAIDRAVREMMQVDPPQGLRQRVLARLNESDDDRRLHFLPQLAFAAVTMVIVLLSAASMWYRGELPTPPGPPAMATGAPAPVVDSETVIQQATVRGESVSVAPPITKEPIRMPRVTNVFGTRPHDVSAATVDAGRREIVAAPLTIVPLSARRIIIEPLIVPPLGKGGQ